MILMISQSFLLISLHRASLCSSLYHCLLVRLEGGELFPARAESAAL